MVRVVSPAVPGTLYVVATPIGNLGDLSSRARDTLASVTRVAAEDTRHTAQLLKGMGLATPLFALHEHNERVQSATVINMLKSGDSIALVSDAGTPLIADPGYVLVRAAREAGIRVVPVPGACAAVTALSIAGLATDRFCFEGFLPARSAARRARLDALKTEERTLVLYEAPHRIGETLADLAAVLGDREATVARELTKLHETLYHGKLGELASVATRDADLNRGEIVVVVAGAEPQPALAEPALARLLIALLAELPVARAVDVAVAATGERRNAIYKLALKLRDDAGRESDDPLA